MQDPQTLEDARAAEQMMQALDELAERTDEVERLRQALATTQQELAVARQALQSAQKDALAKPPEPVVVPPETDTATQAELDELRQKHEQLLRVAADFQNYKRRIETERPRWRAEGKAEGIRPLLNVLDDLQRALDAMGADAPEAIRTGIEGVVRNFENALKTIGVEPIEAVGEPFNTHLHEAIAHPPATDDQIPGTVVAEARRGYRMGDQVLRHSQVVVAG
ncbi:MAG TPA: nucleotide exchange factor GrpE [Rhodothermales bacterium]|nr:nucleotide exchange factor GrpE [Rhodothermales bacterium]